MRELSQSRFAYKKEAQKIKDNAKKSRSQLLKKEKQNKITKAVNLLTSATKNGSKNRVNAIASKLNEETYTEKELKKEIIPILNKYNRNMPITSLSKDAIEEIKEALKNNNLEID